MVHEPEVTVVRPGLYWPRLLVAPLCHEDAT
jgi:hypothetical protein